jgi:GDP-L-fucose synthase
MSELSAFKGTRCVVTGGTGMIGRQVVRLLKEAGAWVVSVSLDHLELQDGVTYVHADLTQYDTCLSVKQALRAAWSLRGHTRHRFSYLC